MANVLTENDALLELERQNLTIIKNPQATSADKQKAMHALWYHFLDIYNKLASAGIEFQIHLTEVALRDPSHVSDNAEFILKLRRELQVLKQETDQSKRQTDLDKLVKNNVIPLTSMALMSHSNELPVYTNNIVTYNGVNYVVQSIHQDPTNLVNTHYLTVSPIEDSGLLLPNSVYRIPHSLRSAYATPHSIIWSDGKTCTSNGGDFTWTTGCQELGLSKKLCRETAKHHGVGKMGLCRALLQHRH